MTTYTIRSHNRTETAATLADALEIARKRAQSFAASRADIGHRAVSIGNEGWAVVDKDDNDIAEGMACVTVTKESPKMNIVVRHSNGTRKTYQTFCDAIAGLRVKYGDRVVAFDSSCVECTHARAYPGSTERVLVWEDEESSHGDSGARAVAEIRTVAP